MGMLIRVSVSEYMEVLVTVVNMCVSVFMCMCAVHYMFVCKQA